MSRPRKKVVWSVSASLIAMFCLAERAIVAQQDELRPFKSSVDVVTIHATVRDGRGRPVRNLKPADFDILDNGERRHIVGFDADDQAPVSIGVLLDVSGSMRIGGKLTVAQRLVDNVLAGLRPDRDEAALFTFDARLHEMHDFTSNFSNISASLPDIEPFGTTSLYDATAAAAEKLAHRSAPHRALIVVTDGLDTSSSMTPEQVSGLASSINVPLFVVAVLPDIDRRRLLDAELRPVNETSADFRDLAEWTGGTFSTAAFLQEAPVVAATLLAELRHQYVIAIEAVTSREWRALQVRVSKASHVVRARSGYFGGETRGS